MTTSILRITATFAAVLVTTAAVCNKDSSASAAPAANVAIATPSAQARPGLPSDFPLAPGLSTCTPTVIGPEMRCEWHNVDQHAIYTFYHDALPKAGYTLLPGGGEITTPHYMGLLGFKKGDVKGAMSIHGGDLTLQVVTGY
ncbi:MAG TPA: hypothetical protein VGO46_05525 [Gemmatimonadaceae bacterium]|jgi:hypothetical protein|nr:hypothetical protein [Gemmatimonadaceae bacterium]